MKRILSYSGMALLLLIAVGGFWREKSQASWNPPNDRKPAAVNIACGWSGNGAGALDSVIGLDASPALPTAAITPITTSCAQAETILAGLGFSLDKTFSHFTGDYTEIWTKDLGGNN